MLEQKIKEVVCARYGISLSEVISKSRKREVVEARYICYKLLKEHTRFSLASIGQIFGGFDHATVLHGIITINNLIETNKGVRDTYQEIHKTIEHYRRLS